MHFKNQKISKHTKFEKRNHQKINKKKIQMALTIVVLKWQNVVSHLSK